MLTQLSNFKTPKLQSLVYRTKNKRVMHPIVDMWTDTSVRIETNHNTTRKQVNRGGRKRLKEPALLFYVFNPVNTDNIKKKKIRQKTVKYWNPKYVFHTLSFRFCCPLSPFSQFCFVFFCFSFLCWRQYPYSQPNLRA